VQSSLYTAQSASLVDLFKQTCHLNFSRKHPACCNLNVRRQLIQISTTFYNQVSELEQYSQTNCPMTNTTAQDPNPGSLSLGPEALPLRHCALHLVTLDRLMHCVNITLTLIRDVIYRPATRSQ